MEWLVEVKMDNNNICRILGSPFSDMPRLRVISMRRNKMTKVSEKILDKIRTNLAVFDIDGNPLQCDCDVLWLQAWAEESSTIGPHCRDGNLLRELHFVPSDCSRKQLDEFTANCDTQQTSLIYSKYTNFRNVSIGEENNNLAPLPQESEYFYDEYVDYPFNESLTTPSPDQQNILDRFLKVNHSALLIPQKSPHVTPGDTPTMYAAPGNNKTKPDIPKEVPHSPSSSGFTFFGVPLPSLNSLNLNKLLGNQRSSNALKPGKKNLPTPAAERKVAIVNMPAIAKATNQNNVFRPPPLFPQMESGGFLPMLPGERGFKPIVHPTIIPLREEDDFEITTERSIATLKPIVVVSRKPDSTAAELGVRTTAPPILAQRKFNVVNATEAERKLPAQRIPTSSSHIRNATLLDVHENSSKIITVKPAKTTIATGNLEVNTKPTPNTFKNLTNPTSILPSNILNRTQPTISSIEEFKATQTPTKPDIVTQKPKLGELTLEKIANVKSGPNKLETGSSLSALLIPGGQQPHTKPSGRPTITKVQSPHTTEPSIQSGRGNYVKNIKDSGERTDTVTLDPQVTRLDENKESWYFANYNKTLPEPYHSMISGVEQKKLVPVYLLPFIYFISLSL